MLYFLNLQNLKVLYQHVTISALYKKKQKILTGKNYKIISHINNFEYKFEKQSMNGISFERLEIFPNAKVKAANIKVSYY